MFNNISIHGHVALLIDADNAQLSYAEQVLSIAEYYGKLEICRAYGDWQDSRLFAWCEKMDTLKIDRIQVKQVGKNATDHRMLGEVGKILGDDLFGPDMNVFIIVSGDGDFASICDLIRESGKQVIGIGNRQHTSKDLEQVCDSFHYLEDLENELNELKKHYPIPPNEVRKFFNPLLFACPDPGSKNEWITYPELEKNLRESVRNFDSEFGKYMLSEWLRHFENDFETNGQMVRRIDINPEFTRIKLMIKAYLLTRQADGRANRGQFGKALRELSDYESRFSDKNLTEWLETYPLLFKIDGNYIIHVNYRPEYASYPDSLYEMQLTFSGIFQNMLR